MQGRFETFTVLITTINRSIRKIKTEEMAEFDLKSPHVSCLYYLYTLDSLTATRLCEICNEDKGAISRSLDYLEKSGLILCRSDDKKRYNSPLELTAKGKEIAESIARKMNGILEKVGVELSDEDRKIMYRSLAVISENLQKLCEGYE